MSMSNILCHIKEVHTKSLKKLQITINYIYQRVYNIKLAHFLINFMCVVYLFSLILSCEFKLLKIKLFKSNVDGDDSAVDAATLPFDVDVLFNETKKRRLSLATIGVLR